MKEFTDFFRYETLVGLLNKLSTQFYDLTPLEFDRRRSVNPEDIKGLQVNKEWYLKQMNNCCEEIAMLMNKLSYDEIISVISVNGFDKNWIESCLQLGVNGIKKSKLNEEPPIVKASIYCLLNELASIRSKLPKPHQVNKQINWSFRYLLDCCLGFYASGPSSNYVRIKVHTRDENSIHRWQIPAFIA